MGGEIGLESAIGEGSCFWFEVPMQFAEPGRVEMQPELATRPKFGVPAALTAQLPTSGTKARQARILVAEDNPTNQRVTQLILESGGHQVTIVNNGEAALDALERTDYDVALFDLSMPVMSGIEALKLYRFSCPDPIPILMLSANVTTEVIAECQRAGASEFVPKPIRAGMLLDAINRHLAAPGQECQLQVIPNNERPTLTLVDTPAVDPRVLRDLQNLSSDPTFLERLLTGFRSDAERLVKEIGDALTARRYQDVKDAAHALKGGAGSVGATQLVALSVRFESADYDTMRLKAAAWSEELSRAVANVLSALDAHLQERRLQHQSGA
jgi:two-component system sensor histidine kinase RpfC